jgi:hypothetical protein
VHQHLVADRQAERSAAAALTVDEDDDRRVEGRHFPQVECDRFRDPALFRFDAGIRSRRVDERNDRPPELLRELHRAQRLAVPLGFRIAEIPEDLLLGIAAPLVVADDEDRLVLIARKSGDHRMVVGKTAIAADFDEVGEQAVDVVEDGRAGRMPGDEDPLPRSEVAVDVRTDRVDPLGETVNRLLPLRRGRQHRQGLDLLHQEGDRFLEFERIGRHSSSISVNLARDSAGHMPNFKLQTPNVKLFKILLEFGIWRLELTFSAG